MSETKLNSDFWRQRYRDKETGWDMGEVSPPLKEYFDTIKDKNIRILIPGAGNSYEGEYLIQQEFTDVTILDYASEALENFKQRVPEYEKAKLVCGDFFKHEGHYDLIIEQTFFCAIDPGLRPAYVNKMTELLKPNGKLVGLLFIQVPDGDGPPFGGSKSEYEKLFSDKFIIEQMEPCKNSIKPRSGRELFIILGKKG